MAIVLDATSNGVGIATTSLSTSHVNAGNILVVGISAGASDIVTSVTYNSIAMTRIDVRNNGNSTAYLYYLLAPSVGTFNTVITTNTSATISMAAVSFVGVKQSVPDASATSVATGTTSLANTVTTLVDNSIHIAAFAVDTFGTTSITNGTLIANGVGYSNPLLISPAAAHTLTANAGGNNAWASVGAAFAPAPPSVATGDVSYSFFM